MKLIVPNSRPTKRNPQVILCIGLILLSILLLVFLSIKGVYFDEGTYAVKGKYEEHGRYYINLLGFKMNTFHMELNERVCVCSKDIYDRIEDGGKCSLVLVKKPFCPKLRVLKLEDEIITRTKEGERYNVDPPINYSTFFDKRVVEGLNGVYYNDYSVGSKLAWDWAASIVHPFVLTPVIVIIWSSCYLLYIHVKQKKR